MIICIVLQNCFKAALQKNACYKNFVIRGDSQNNVHLAEACVFRINNIDQRE